MALKPRLEFFRFTLRYRDNKYKTFRDFSQEILGAPKTADDEKVLEFCFKHFLQQLKSGIAIDSSRKKRIGFEKKKSINRHFDKGPRFDSSSHTIFGVINGGSFGQDRTLTNIEDEEDSSRIGLNKAVNMYFFFLAYVPPDHDQGLLMIHSNGRDENIVPMFRNFMMKVFSGKKFSKPDPEDFAPKAFQDEYKKSAVLKEFVFKNVVVDDIHSTDGIKQRSNAYSVRIEAKPLYGDVRGSEAEGVFSRLKGYLFGKDGDAKPLSEFNAQLVLEDEHGHSQKTFEWNAREVDFAPVVYLDGRVEKVNEDGTPDFDELRDFCQELLKSEILPEMRPDLDVAKVD